MGQYIDVAGPIADEASQGGADELQAFTTENLSAYIARFQMHQANLDQCKIYFGNIEQTAKIDNVDKSIMSQMKNIANQANDIKTYASSKGGADILPTDQLNDVAEDIAKKIEQNMQDNLSAGKDNIEYNKAVENFRRVILEIGRDVYKLREEVTGITEYFAFTYKGNTGAMASTTVSVDQFFNSLLNDPAFQNVLKIEFRGSGLKDWSFRFNKAATKSVLSQLVDKNKAKEWIIDTILNKDGIAQSAMELYQAERNRVTTSFVPYKQLRKGERKKIDAKFSDDIYRTDYGYLVVRKNYQTGFIAQSIFNAFINQSNYNYETDRIAWYKGADVMDNKSNIGYSVKNLLDQAPTLFAVNSVERALYEINTTLNRVQHLDIGQIREALRKAVFSSAQEMDVAANTDIETLLDILGY